MRIGYARVSTQEQDNTADAVAICEAVMRPNMRFVPIKSEDAQATLAVHRVRQAFIEERTATINRIRGLMSKFGIVLPQKADTIRRGAHMCVERLPGWASRAIGDLHSHLSALDERIRQYDEASETGGPQR